MCVWDGWHTVRAGALCSKVVIAMLLEMGSAWATGAPEVFAQLGHSDKIHSIAFSADGRFLASAGEDGAGLIWDVATQREYRSFSRSASPLNAVAFSTDGSAVATGSQDGTIVLWDVASGRQLKILQGHSGPVTALAFAHNGQALASASADRSVKLWEPASGRAIGTLSGHRDTVTTVAFTSDDRFLVSGSVDKTIKIWDSAAGKEVRTLSGHSDRVTAVAICATSNFFASSSWDHTVKIWDLVSGREQRTLTGHTSEVWSVACSSDGRMIASGGYDHSARLWDTATGRELKSIPADSGWVESLVFSPDGRSLATAGADHSIKIWKTAGGELQHTFEGHADYVKSLAFSPNGKMLVSAGADRMVRLWLVSDAHVLRTIAAHDSWVGSVAFSPDNRAVASRGGDGTLKLWDIITGKLVHAFTVAKAQSGSASIAFAPDGRTLAAGSEAGVIKLWQLPNGIESRSLTGTTGSIEALAFSPDGRNLASGDSRGNIRLWDLAADHEARTLSGHTAWVGSVAFSPDGKTLASGGGDQTVRIWDVDSGRERATLRGHAGSVTSVAFDPSGARLASSDARGAVKLWDLASARETKALVGHTDLVESVAFSPDGRLLATASADSTIRLWDVGRGEEQLRLLAFRDGSVLRFTPQGYFDSQGDGAEDYLNVRADDTVTGIAAYRERFYRPDLVRLALGGQPVPPTLPTLVAVKPAPDVTLSGVPSDTDASELDLHVQLEERGGGLGTTRTYLNESAVSEIAGSASQTIHMKLLPGRNEITVVAFNADGSKRSNPAQAVVTAHFDPAGKPQLHGLVVGIQDFDNPDIGLRYSVADAQAFANLIQEKAAPLFSKVNIQTLIAKPATTKDAIKAALARYRSIEPRDVFLFYVATHGTVEGDIGHPEYFLIPSNMKEVSTEGIRREALSENDIRQSIASIPATRKLILLDTCYAGAMGDAMLLTTRSQEENGAVNVLSGAVGSTVLSASTNSQEALEGENGHGLFTWVLLKGLGGDADLFHHGSIKTFELAAYVSEIVPQEAQEHFKHPQTPNLHNAGQSFEIVSTR